MCLSCAAQLITLLVAPNWTLADRLVTRELKHDLSCPLRNVISHAKPGGSQRRSKPCPLAHLDPSVEIAGRTPADPVGDMTGLVTVASERACNRPVFIGGATTAAWPSIRGMAARCGTRRSITS